MAHEQQIMELVLVEDQETDAELTILALRDQGFSNKITHLWDGGAALEYLLGEEGESGAGKGPTPILVLLDLRLPKADGIEVLKRLKTDPRTRTIPVVVLTSSDEEPDIQRCYELGANSYIVKPVDFEKLTKVVADLGYFWIMVNEPPARG